jgi:hypothetical protein
MKLTGAGGGYDAQPPYTTSHSPAKSSTGVPIGTTQATFSLKDDRTDDEGTTLATISMTGPDGTKTCSTGTPTLTCSGTASNYSITYPGMSLSYNELASFTLTATDGAGNVLNESWSWTVEPTPSSIPGGGANPPYAQSTYLTGLTWDNTGLARKGPGSDMWPSTWASDDLIYVAYGDGGGLNGWNDVCRTRFGVHAVTGTPTSFTASNIHGCKSDDTGCIDTSWSSHDAICNASYANQFTDYVEGIIAIDTTMYAILSNQTAPVSSAIAHSENNGQTWAKYGWNWSRTSAGTWFPFGFVQFGAGYAGARDTYLYLVGGEMENYIDTYLARVPKNDVGTQGSYEWYTSVNPASPTWGAWGSRQPIFTDNNLAYVSGMFYFPVLDRYIVPSTHGTSSINTGDLGKLGVFEAEEPWGPWYTVYYSDNWQGYVGNYALQFPIVQKWTSANNLVFYMVYSSSGYRDAWNMFKGTFEATPFPTLTITTTTLASATVGDSATQTLSASGGQTPYTWSLLSGALPTGRSLAASGDITGNYTGAGTFNFTVQAQDTLSTTDNQALSQVIVPASTAGEVVATITAITDTWVNSGAADTNYSTSTESRTYQWPFGVVANRSLWQIDHSTLPANISITAAALEVYLTGHDGSGGTDPMPSYLYRVTGTLPTISTVTWNNFAGTLGTAVSITDVGLTAGWYSFPLLGAMQASYVAGTSLTLALDGSTASAQDTNRIFASMNHGTSAWRPRLKVTYTLPVNITPPNAPTGHSVSAGDGKVNLYRGTSAGATAYNAYYTSNGTTPSKSNGTKLTGISDNQALQGLLNGTAYKFVFTATNTGGESSESSVDTATPTAPPVTPVVPAAPTSSAVVSMSGAVTIYPGSSPGATSYNAYYTDNGALPSKTAYTVKITGATGGRAITGLTNGTTYKFIFTAVNATGESDASGVIAVIPQAAVGINFLVGGMNSIGNVIGGQLKNYVTE